jgi:hypothetical protein
MNKCDATIVTKTKSSQKTNCDHYGVFNDVNVTSLMTTSLLVKEGNYTRTKENKKPNKAKEWKKRREQKTLTKRRK